LVVGEGEPVSAPAAHVSPPFEGNFAWELLTMPLMENFLIDFLSNFDGEIQKRWLGS
jgi:hypothetical protein